MTTKENLILVSKKGILGEVAKWAVFQSPYIPEGLEKILSQLRDKLNACGLFDQKNENMGFAEMDYWDLRSFMDKNLKSIPEFKDLNLSKVEKERGIKVDDPGRTGFVGTSRYDKLRDEYDFVDLDALIINVCNNLQKD